MKQKVNKTKGLVVITILIATMLLLGGVSPGRAQGVTDDVCSGCHDDIATAFANTAHGAYLADRPDLADHKCEACHGSGVAHAEEGNPSKILNPAKMDQFSGKPLCLNCHRDEHLDDWLASPHAQADVNCTACHSVHEAYTGAVTRTQTPDLCYGCHPEVRAASYMPSHHPVAEGKMDCQDCHNVHGGGATLTADQTKRELCFSCHPEKEGPFIFEHAPVNEDCMICHAPHGSVADKLLKQTEPALCLNCHPMHFHASIEGVDGDFTVPLDPERNGTSTPDGWKVGFLTKCTQCHTEIHGSDLPSQAISAQGKALTR
ncbi:MAG: DmsE family decaheme c-type cytochrome [Candidatus Zixiibacteriota bacterium]|nr:MAG: DmsE family decaheme c-type cytochrome [candidate division Zixibacteria bacterium]